MKLYGVFAYPRLAADREFLGAYTTRERAQALIDAQEPNLRDWMHVEEIEIDRYPNVHPWINPDGECRKGNVSVGY